jgi:predicted small lipoprotein YifL
MFPLVRLAAQALAVVGLLWSLAACGLTALWLIRDGSAADPAAFARWCEVAEGVPWMLVLCALLWIAANGPRRPRPRPEWPAR